MNSNLLYKINRSLSHGLRWTLLTGFIYLISLNSLQATHIVGGQLTYRSLGNNYFEISVIFRRDCKFGADTVPFDNPALLGVFYGDNQKAFRIGNDGVIPLKLTVNDTLHETIDSVCIGKFTEVCVHQTIYRDTVFLPFEERGYILAYQRCCRNITLLNILDPLETGATYVATITSANLVENNSNPLFDDFPPIYICSNKPFNFNHSAIDYDGDSLVYTLCAPFKGKNRLFPAGRPDPPPYDTILWKSPFSVHNVLGSPFNINPATGMITALPQYLGQYLVGVCVYEYDKRSRKLKGYSRRDFELNVVPCGLKAISLFERTNSICEGLTVKFKNKSIDGIDFTWYFDWVNNRNLISHDFNPAHTYSKAGKYEVVLVVKNGDCDDTSRLTITVIDPNLKPDFDYTVECDKAVNIQLNDKSTANGQITKREWIIKGPNDSIVSSEKDPLIKLNGDGKLNIQLIITDENGCTASITKMVDVNIIEVQLVADSVTICYGDSIRLVKNPNPNIVYNWDPKTGLNLSDPSNPLAGPIVSTKYKVTITDGLCESIKEITVFVRDRIKVSIMGDTSVCDGMVELIAKSDSSTMFIWSLNPTFSPVIHMGDTLKTGISGTKTYYVKAGKDNQCPDSASIIVSDHSIDLKYKKEYTICAGDTILLDVVNANTIDILTILWKDNPIIIGPKDVLTPKISCPQPGRYVLCFTVNNQFGCELTDSIIIIAVLAPNPEFTIENECGSLTIKVNTNSHGKVKWTFGDGVGTSIEKMTSYTYKKPGKYIVTLMVDSVCVRSLSKEITVIELILQLNNIIISCFGGPVQLNPGGNPAYKYEWSPKEGLDDPFSHNPTATTSDSTKYYVKVTDPNFPDACFLFDSVCVFVPPALVIVAGPDTTLCERGKITLCVSANLTGTEFEWCDEFNKPIGKTDKIEVNPEKSTYYIIKAIDTFGCSLNDTVFVFLHELKASIKSDDIICIGDTVCLRVITSDGTRYEYEWSPSDVIIIGSKTDSFICVFIDKTTTFTLKVKNNFGCEWELKKTIQVNNPQLELFVKAEPEKIVLGNKTQLTATFNPNWRYLWFPHDGSLSDSSIYNPVAMPMTTTKYTVTVIDQSGCTASAEVLVTVQTCLESIFLPNAFSPNNDNSNDVLYVRSLPNSITKMELVIYSRWGQKVFSTTDITIGWDGRFDGKELPPDVYGYGLIFTCRENQEFVKKGNVSIIK